MSYLADGVDIPSWGGLILSITIAVLGGIVFLIRNVRPATPDGGDNQIVARLDKRIDELEQELNEERRGRADDNRRHTEQQERIREEHRREIQKLSEDMADLRTAYEVFKAQAQGRWPNNMTNGGI